MLTVCCEISAGVAVKGDWHICRRGPWCLQTGAGNIWEGEQMPGEGSRSQATSGGQRSPPSQGPDKLSCQEARTKSVYSEEDKEMLAERPPGLSQSPQDNPARWLA